MTWNYQADKGAEKRGRHYTKAEWREWTNKAQASWTPPRERKVREAIQHIKEEQRTPERRSLGQTLSAGAISEKTPATGQRPNPASSTHHQQGNEKDKQTGQRPNGFEDWKSGTATRQAAGRKLRSLRAAQALLGPEDDALKLQLEAKIDQELEVARGALPIEQQEEEAVRALAEAKVKAEACADTLQQVTVAHERAVAEQERCQKALQQVRRKKMQTRSPQEVFTANTATQMATTLSSLRSTAVWSPNCERVAVDPALLETMVTLVGALSEGPRPALQSKPVAPQVFSMDEDDWEEEGREEPPRPEQQTFATPVTTPTAVSAPPSAHGTSDEEMSDNSLQQAMRLTRMRPRQNSRRPPSEGIVSKTRLKQKTRTYQTMPTLPQSPQVGLQSDPDF